MTRTRDRLAGELRKIGVNSPADKAAKYEAFAKRAETGEFDDYADTYVCPITQLHAELMAAGLRTFASRVANGEFDATKEESDEDLDDAPDAEAASRRQVKRLPEPLIEVGQILGPQRDGMPLVGRDHRRPDDGVVAEFGGLVEDGIQIEATGAP